MKYTHSEAFFVAHCVRVAMHNVGVEDFPGDVVEEGGGEGGEGEEGDEAAMPSSRVAGAAV